jgi:hypothetical protein
MMIQTYLIFLSAITTEHYSARNFHFSFKMASHLVLTIQNLDWLQMI